MSHLKNRYYYAKMVENARINFQSVLIAPCCFLGKKNVKFFGVALPFVLCNGAVGCIMNVNVSIGILPIPHWTFTCFSKTAIKARCKKIKQGVKFVKT